jgi:hypothetical protein
VVLRAGDVVGPEGAEVLAVRVREWEAPVEWPVEAAVHVVAAEGDVEEVEAAVVAVVVDSFSSVVFDDWFDEAYDRQGKVMI